MRVVILPAARRDLDNLGRDMATRVETTIDRLAEAPRPPGCRMLRDRASRTWRVRVGDWRILYDIDESAGVVAVLRVFHRSQAY